MNLAVGFICPECRHDTANVLELIMDDSHILTGHRLQCARCETVFVEMDSRVEEEPLEELVLDEAIGRR